MNWADYLTGKMAVDFEFHGAPGECPTVVCMVALELRTGRRIRRRQDALYKLSAPPFSIDESALYIAFLQALSLVATWR